MQLRFWKLGFQNLSFLCLGALLLLYPAAPPSVFDYYIVKYTAPAVALEREYVVGFLGCLFV